MDLFKEDTTIIRSLLSIEHEQIASKLHFINKKPKQLKYADLLKALDLISRLSKFDNDQSKKTIVTLCAIIWAYKDPDWDGLKDHLMMYLSRIGYPPTATMIDLDYDRSSHTLTGLNSLITEFAITLNHLSNEVMVGSKSYLLTNFQCNIWNKIDEHKILGISAPTSAGKSFVILLKSIELLLKNPGAVVYIVPTLSLVSQVSTDFRYALNDFEMHDYEIHTSYSNQCRNYKVIYVLTQEKAIAAFAQSDNPFPHVRVLIVDEIQNVERVADEADQRAKTLYDSLIDFRFASSPDNIIISGPRIDKISLLGFEIFGEKSEEEESKSSPVINFTYTLSKNKNTYYFKMYSDLLEMPLSLLVDSTHCITGYGGALYNDKFHNFLSELVHNLGKGSKNIIFSPNPNQARKTAIAISSKKATSDNNLLDSLISYISSTVHPKYDLCDVLKKGVAYHHGQLPHHVRRVLEVAISEKIIENVVCTTTLMQGVNLPAQNIIIRNPHLYVKIRPGEPKLTHYEIANLRGRAGRLLKDFIGRAFVLDEDAFQNDDQQQDMFEDKTKELHPGYGGKFNQFEKEINYGLMNNEVPSLNNEEFSFLLTYVRQVSLKHGDAAPQRLRTVGIEINESTFKEMTSQLSTLKVPKEVCFKNRYWDPFDLDKIYRSGGIFNIPTSASEEGISNKLKKAVVYLQREFPVYHKRYFRIPEYPGKDMLLSACISAEQWLKEKPLKTILSSDYYNDSSNIDTTISLLQNKISYGLPMLLKPLYDISNPQSMFLRFIETGAFQPCTRRLVELNIPRETAIYLNNAYFRTLPVYVDDLDSIIINVLRKSHKDVNYWVRSQITSLI